MSSFMRPEARATLWRWREVIVGLALLAFGLWWVIGGFGVVRGIGFVICAVAIALILAGAQRSRFRQTGTGPGVVQVTERRLAYFGPLTGGTMDIEDVTRLELEPKARPAAHWIVSGMGGKRLEIPVNATGADDLFDLFGALPNLNTESMLTVLSRTPDARVLVWERTPDLLH